MGFLNHNWLVDFYNICNKDPFRRKVLLADHYDQAGQWLNWITKEHGPLLGVETETLTSLVVNQTKPELARRGVRFLNSKQTFWVVQNLMVDLVEQNKYINAKMITPGIVRSFHHAIEEFRGAGICASELSTSVFENEQKGLYIIELLSLYKCWLEQNHFTDFAGLLDYIPENEAATNNHLYILRDMERFSSAEKEMLRLIAGDRLLILQQDGTFPSFIQNEDYLDIRLYHATGTLAEVREAFRRICNDEYSFDQTEIVVSNYEAYSSTLYTLSQVLDIPCTFSQGLPITYTKVGMAALVYLEWLACNYDVECLLKALRHNYMSFHHFGDSVDKDDLILALEHSGIGWGRHRYSMLEATGNVELRGRHTAAIRRLDQVFKRLFQKIPDLHQGTWTPMVLLSALIDFLENYTCPFSDADSLVIAELINQMKLLEVVSPRTLSSESALRYVKEMVEDIRVFGSGPACGKLHISSLQDGGISGRNQTYILGMSNETWSLQFRQDPVLLDMERRSLAGLLLSTERTEHIIHERETRLMLLSGRVTLSYSSYDPAEQKEIIPSFVLLQAARIVKGDPQMDLTGLGQLLGKPVGYISIDPIKEQLLDGTDRWLGRFHTEGKLQDGLFSLLHSFPFAAKLEQAEMRISENALSEYEGILSTDNFTVSYLNNPETYLSVTQLERYAECPKKFFFSHVLKLRAKKNTEFDRSRWLEPASRGDLLHRIFYRYLKEMSEDSIIEDRIKQDKQRLQEITEQVIREYEAMAPPPTPHIFQKECDTLRGDVAIFYQVEQTTEGRPRFVELELTLGGQPMSVKLDNGIVIRMKGFVDRVDEIEPHKYKIYDYKTGSPAKYDENEYFSQGTQLQHALYAVAVEQWLKLTGIDMEACVVESAYYFPTERGNGNEVSRVQNKTGELSELVGHLLASMELGTFAATTESKRCSFCDYGAACRNESEHSKGKWNLAPNNSLLHHIKEVERFG